MKVNWMVHLYDVNFRQVSISRQDWNGQSGWNILYFLGGSVSHSPQLTVILYVYKVQDQKLLQYYEKSTAFNSIILTRPRYNVFTYISEGLLYLTTHIFVF